MQRWLFARLTWYLENNLEKLKISFFYFTHYTVKVGVMLYLLVDDRCRWGEYQLGPKRIHPLYSIAGRNSDFERLYFAYYSIILQTAVMSILQCSLHIEQKYVYNFVFVCTHQADILDSHNDCKCEVVFSCKNDCSSGQHSFHHKCLPWATSFWKRDSRGCVTQQQNVTVCKYF